jgi:hypothetical protein
MNQFLFLGHTSLNYVYAEHHRRELLAEAEREQQLELVPGSRFTWASVFSSVMASLQTLLRVRTRVTDSEVSAPSPRHADRPQDRRPDRPVTVLGREGRGQWRAIAGRRIGEGGCAEGGFRGSRPNARDWSADPLGSCSGSCPRPRSVF